jgi:membrane-bound lytic murein transglycosylase MltF
MKNFRPAKFLIVHLVLTAFAFSLAFISGEAAAIEKIHQKSIQKIKEKWTGDLDGIIKRRIIRALVAYNKTNYFLDGPTARGITYENLKHFEKQLNNKLKKRHFKIQVLFVPVVRDKLIPYLVEGRGDIAAANLTITTQRLKQIDFGDPFSSQVKELVVTSPSAPPLNSLDDLSGKKVYVNKSSSFYESLQKLNQKFAQAGKPPITIEPADEYLETEDILELVNADSVGITVADSHLALFWKQIFKKIKVHEGLALRQGGKIAWAIRKNSPQLKKEINLFVKKNKQGTLMGNILIKRYFRNTKWARNVMSDQDIKRFRSTIKFFQKYSGQYGFDWLMVAALAYQESRLDQSKRSPKGAVGVMQLLPSTAAGPPISIRNIEKLEKNIHAGVKYLRFIYDQYFKNGPMNKLNKVLLTFASYNAGPARVEGLRRRTKKMGLDPDIWFRNVEVAAARVIGRETVQYVSNIFKYYLTYKQVSANMAQKNRVKAKVKDK